MCSFRALCRRRIRERSPLFRLQPGHSRGSQESRFEVAILVVADLVAEDRVRCAFDEYDLAKQRGSGCAYVGAGGVEIGPAD